MGTTCPNLMSSSAPGSFHDRYLALEYGVRPHAI